MKKNRLLLYVLPVFAVLAVFFLTVKPASSVATTPTVQTVAPTSPDQSCGGSCLFFTNCCNWNLVNGVMSISGSTVNFSAFAFCYQLSSTPPWSTNSQIGTISSTYRPAGQRVINATTSGGTIIQCTIMPNGDWYVQYVSGPALGSGAMISGSYSL